MMSLNTEVDVDLLAKHFELNTFNGFHTPHAEDKNSLRHITVVSSFQKTVDTNCEEEELPTIYEDISDSIIHEGERHEMKSLNICSCNGDGCNGKSMLESICEELITSSKFKDCNPPEVGTLKSTASTFKRQFGLAVKQEKQARYRPSYFGKRNALCIELLAVHSSYNEREFVDFFGAPFDSYPDHDYCLISLPFTSPTFPLINHFVRCVPKDQSEFPQDIYVLHRNAALSHIFVRWYDYSDFEEVICLLKTIKFHKEVDITFLRSGKIGVKSCRTIIFESEGAIIGFAIIKEEDDLENLKAHYKVENFHKFHHYESTEHGEIVQFILSPIFHRHSKLIIREILRLTDKEFLFYRLYTSTKVYYSNTMNALGEMMPVLPRKHPLSTLSMKKGENGIQKDFALYLMNSKLTNRMSIHVNARIIVIGASTTALSFLESLIFSSARRFFILQNITLVSPFGIPSTTGIDNEAVMFAFNPEFYSNEYLNKLSLFSWINIVFGYMTVIDRKKKRIVINNARELNYDYLIITTGKQFSDEFLKLSDTFHHSLQRKRQSDVLRNSFCINSYKEASSLRKYLRKNFQKSSPRKIVVYGNCLEAYAIIEALRRCQYPGDAIIFAEKFHSDSVTMTCFNDFEVYQRVTRAMRTEGIEILRDYQLVSWFVNSDKNELTNIKFSKSNDYKKFKCLVLISCGIKSTNSITSAGKIVVYGNCLEAYAIIEALRRCQYPGDAIIFAEKFHSDSVTMTCFNDFEVYQRVTRAMRTEGIEILRDYQLVSWFVNSDKNELTNIKFSKSNDYKKFKCLVLISCGIKSTNSITSAAIIESSLVYQNGLVIGQDFSTDDPFIFGAGTGTRYRKQLYADQFEHRFYNSREVGKKLHKELRHLWNPYNKQGMEANEFQIGQYKKPIIKACKVPGGNYLQIHKPGIQKPLEKSTGHSYHGTVLITDGCSSESESYFCIHLNVENVIEGITCYSVKHLDIGNIIILYGKHERSLNYLHKRYKLGKIMDFQKHFSTQWTNVISYDGFSNIYAKMTKLFKTVNECEDSDEISNVLRKIKNNK
ncbi:hypothetical protein J437_LFUL014728, partial [Ladona fulva]